VASNRKKVKRQIELTWFSLVLYNVRKLPYVEIPFGKHARSCDLIHTYAFLIANEKNTDCLRDPTNFSE